MIVAAGLLVLLGLGLFAGGLATGTTVLYWATVAVCALAAVLLVLSRRGLPDPARAEASAPRRSTSPRRRHEAGAPVERAQPTPEPEVPAAVPPSPATAPVEDGEPPVEEVEFTDLLLVVDLTDDVFVLDEHPRYHLAECRRLAGQEPVPLPLGEARTDGFTPCGLCSPDRTLAQRERARRAGRPI